MTGFGSLNFSRRRCSNFFSSAPHKLFCMLNHKKICGEKLTPTGWGLNGYTLTDMSFCLQEYDGIGRESNNGKIFKCVFGGQHEIVSWEEILLQCKYFVKRTKIRDRQLGGDPGAV